MQVVREYFDDFMIFKQSLSIRIAVICGSIRMHVADTMLYIDRATTAHHSGWETMYLAVDEITFLTFCPATVLVVIISVQRPHKTIAINKNPLYILFCNILYGKFHLFDNYDDSYARERCFGCLTRSFIKYTWRSVACISNEIAYQTYLLEIKFARRNSRENYIAYRIGKMLIS